MFYGVNSGSFPFSERTFSVDWEANHFKKELGDLIIARILRENNGVDIQLNADNIDLLLAEDHRRLQKLLTTPSPLLSEVDDLLSPYKDKLPLHSPHSSPLSGITSIP